MNRGLASNCPQRIKARVASNTKVHVVFLFDRGGESIATLQAKLTGYLVSRSARSHEWIIVAVAVPPHFSSILSDRLRESTTRRTCKNLSRCQKLEGLFTPSAAWIQQALVDVNPNCHRSQSGNHCLPFILSSSSSSLLLRIISVSAD